MTYTGTEMVREAALSGLLLFNFAEALNMLCSFILMFYCQHKHLTGQQPLLLSCELHDRDGL